MKELSEILDAAVRRDAGVWFESGQAKIWLKDRSKGLYSPTQNYLQRKIQRVVSRMEELKLPKRIIALKPRQKGSTTYFAALDYHELRRKSTHAVVIGGEYSQTHEILEMLRTYQGNDGFNWGNTGDINAKTGSWTNGSRLKPETARDVLAGIAGTYQVLHATEVARWARFGVANADGVLTNIVKCVPLIADTLIVLESTAEGAAGAFYERWCNAVDAEDFLSGRIELTPGSYVRVFAPFFEFEDSAVRLTAEQKALIKKTLDDDEEYSGEKELLDTYGRDDNGVTRLGTSVKTFDAWEQLAWRRWSIREECKRDKAIFDRDYPSDWTTAFMKSGNLRFNATGLKMLRKRLSQRQPMPGIIEESNRRVAFRQTERNEAQVIVFEKPLVGRRYLLAVDPMTGATQVGGQDPDYHGVFVMRAGYWDDYGKWTRPATAATVIPCRWDIDVLEVVVWRLSRYYGTVSGCKIAVEVNLDRGLIELLKLRGANLYEREAFNQREFKEAKAFGYLTTKGTREKLIDGLASAIREWDTPGHGIDVFCEDTIDELENFVVKMNGRSEAAENHHDDRVLALALGLELIDQATVKPAELVSRDLPPDLRPQEQTHSPSPYS